MYIAVCEDQKEEMDLLLELLQQWQRERKIVLRIKSFQNAADLLDVARKEKFTLYLLDVMMPGINGMDAAREIRSFDTSAEIVFLTSFSSFAYESYGVKALDYLLKPVSAELLFPVLDRLLREEEKLQEGLTLKTKSTIIRVPFSQLVYLEVINRCLYFNLTDGSVFEVAGQLKDYEDILLSRPEFMRPHRSYIVNMLRVKEFSADGIYTFTGKNLPVSRRVYSQLKKDYMNLLFTERKG